jgi:two-component system nitrate/nitrite response regulator NarL
VPAQAAAPCQAGSAAAATTHIRIVIAEELPIFRDGLRRLLETDSRLSIVGETGDRLTVPQLVRELSPDILLLGFSSLCPSLVGTLREIAECGTGVRTIILTGAVHAPEVVEAVQHGAAGVLSKDSLAEVLFKGIDSVMDGHYWIGNAAGSDVAASLRKFNVERRRAKAFGLTRRELEIVRVVVSGYTNKQIARQFSISESTVKRHITHIFDKLGASNRIEVALFAAHHRLLDGF